MNLTVKQNKNLLLKLTVLLSLLLCTLVSWSIISRAAEKTFYTEDNFSIKAVEESDTSCKIVFIPNTALEYIDIHYIVNNGNQLNVAMTNNGNEWSYTISGISKGDSLEMFFTYKPVSSGAIDSSWVTYTMGTASEDNNSGNSENNTQEETISNILIEAESCSKMSGVSIDSSQISSFETNDWMRYQTSVTNAGKYRIMVHGKSDNRNGIIVFRDADKRIATVTIHTGAFADYSSDTIELVAGSLELTAIAVAGNITADWIELQPVQEENSDNQGGTTEVTTENPGTTEDTTENSGNTGGTTENPDDTDASNPPENPTSTTQPVVDTTIEEKDGKMIFQFNNLTNGKYADNQIYWCILGIDPDTEKYCYVEADGTKKPLSASLNTISVGDRFCADICNTVAENKYVYMPSIRSGRMYISYGEQVYITVNEDANGNVGFAGPDMNNTSDPNRDVYFEFLEFTIGGEAGPTQYWGNTTRVDNFCFPIVTRLIGETNGEVYDRTVGDVGSREYIFTEFINSVPDEFKNLTDDYRIFAPCKGSFNEGKENADYFQSTIDAFWEKYSNETLTFECEGGNFEANIEGDKIYFTELRSGKTGVVDKPTTQDVLEGRGAFDRQSGQGDGSLELVFEAQLCAAFNRGLALTPEYWYTPEKYYPEGSICNYYSKFWHEHSVDGYAYGFCYDDVFDQSTLLQCTKAKQLVIDLKW